MLQGLTRSHRTFVREECLLSWAASCLEPSLEAKEHVDTVVVGEAENVWEGLIEDFKNGCLKPFYKADGFCSMEKLPFRGLIFFAKMNI